MLELFIYIFDLLQIAPDFTPDIWSNLDYLPEALEREYAVRARTTVPGSTLAREYHILRNARRTRVASRLTLQSL